MIRRNEFNKILQLIDAGILSSEKGLLNHIDSLNPIMDIETFTVDLNDPKPVNVSRTIEQNLLEIDKYVTDLNNLQNIRISKNFYVIKWFVEVSDLAIDIENVNIEMLEINSGKLKSIDEINTFFITEFTNIIGFIKNPVGTYNSNTNFNSSINKSLAKFKVDFANDYLNFIKQTSLKFKYSISLYYEKLPKVEA